MCPETGEFEQEIMMPAPPELVFDMLLDPANHAEFTQTKVEGSSVVGGEMTAGNGYIRIKHIALERGKGIVQEWSTIEWPEDLPPSRLEIRLRPIGQGTHVWLCQTGVPRADLDKYYEGWYQHYWNPLFEHLRELSTKRNKKE